MFRRFWNRKVDLAQMGKGQMEGQFFHGEWENAWCGTFQAVTSMP